MRIYFGVPFHNSDIECVVTNNYSKMLIWLKLKVKG